MAHRSKVWIVLIYLAALSAWGEVGTQRSLNIYVYNQAKVADGVLSQAEGNATRIFRFSGVQAIWVNCSTSKIEATNCTGLPHSGDVIVQIVHETRILKDDVFGAAFIGTDGTGQYADVYVDRVNQLHRDWNVSLANVLAHIMAHEIGHLLLGLNSHSSSGIMRGVWEADELKAAERGRLLFSREQSKSIQDRLNAISARRDLRTVSELASTRPGS